jgi:hypothetical protein
VSAALRSRAAVVVAALVALVTLLAGCAGIPASGPPQEFTDDGGQTTAPEGPDLRYDAIQPQPGEPPLEIVKDFIAVGGSHEDQHAGARAYLTPAAAKSWKDAAGVVAIEDSPVYLRPEKGGAEIVMSAQKRGRLDADGAYHPDGSSLTHRFHLEKVAGEWRIADPPAGVLVYVSTFQRAWRQYSVFFLNSTRTQVVPDVRLVPYPQENALPSLLVGDLAAGPSTALQGAVRSDLEGVRLQSNVVRDKDRVRVYLTGLGGSTDTLEDGGFAQLLWTLYPLGVGGVEVFLDNKPVAPRNAPDKTLQRFGDWATYDPEDIGVSTPGYFVRNGTVRTTADRPVPGPAGIGAYAAASVGVSVDQRSMAVVGRRADGVGLYVGRVGGPLRLNLTARSLTAPTWGSAVDEVWTVKDGKEIVLVQASGATSRVTAADLDRVGPLWSLRLSRDGARVAVVAGPPGGQRLFVGIIVRQNGAPRIDGLRVVDVGAGPVSDVSWSDALTLAVLVRAREENSALYTVSIDGRASGQPVAAAGLSGPPSGVAAAPHLPLLVVAGRAVWSSPGSGEPWSRVTSQAADDSAPAYPG